MTSRIVKTLAFGTFASVLLTLTGAAQAQRMYTGPFEFDKNITRGWSFYPFTPVPSLPDCEYEGQTVKLSLNTGTGGAPLGSADPIWTLASGSPVYSTATVAPWLPNKSSATPPANWIQPDPSGVAFSSFPTGATYVYTTQFSTPFHPYFYTSISISGIFAGDDSALLTLAPSGVTINCPSLATSPNATCFHAGKPFNISTYQSFARTGSAPFVNTLTIQVVNVRGAYSGLFVQAAVTAVCSKCTSPVPQDCGSTACQRLRR